MKKDSGEFVSSLVVLVIAAAVLAGLAFFIWKSYDGRKESIRSEMAALEDFDPAEAEREVADRLGIALPVKPPTASPDEISKMAEQAVAQLMKEEFSTREYSEKKLEISRKYSPAKRGDRVKFSTMHSSQTISGIFEGVTDVFVIVDKTKYRVNDIVEEYRYIFDPDIADKLARDEIAAFEAEYKDRKKKFAEEKKPAIEKELYKKHGYLDNEGGWTPPAEVLRKTVEFEERKFSQDRERKKIGILEKNKLFGFIRVSPDAKTADAPKDAAKSSSAPAGEKR